MSKVLVTVDGGIAVITLNRPEVRNALDMEAAELLTSHLRDLNSREDLRACVLTGNGPAFCAGADLKARQQMSLEEQQRHTETIFGCTNALESLAVPVIAAINGPALAGGMELAIACDVRVAARSAIFGLPEINIGLFPGSGGPIRLPRLVGLGWAKLMVLTGMRLDAAEAHRIGIVEMLVDDDRLMEEARVLADRIAANSPAGVRAAKALLNNVPDMPFSAAAALSMALRHPLNRTPEAAQGMRNYKPAKGNGE